MKFLSAERHDFGKDLDSINVELSNPNTFKDNTFHFIFDVSNNFYFYKYIDNSLYKYIDNSLSTRVLIY
ncbi:hypothetical protein HpCK30_10270 [Helicobacter pylori]